MWIETSHAKAIGRGQHEFRDDDDQQHYWRKNARLLLFAAAPSSFYQINFGDMRPVRILREPVYLCGLCSQKKEDRWRRPKRKMVRTYYRKVWSSQDRTRPGRWVWIKNTRHNVGPTLSNDLGILRMVLLPVRHAVIDKFQWKG